jgi:hypothetical protein
MSGYIYQLQEKDKAALGAVRCISGLVAAADADTIWLRDDSGNAEPPAALKQLPVVNTFYTDEQDHLIPAGSLTPTGKLKQLEWLPLTIFIPVKAPVAAMPGVLDQPAVIQLKYSGQQRKGRALLTSLTNWKQYAEFAPAARLELLRFAVEENGDVFITGDLLPPLPGNEYWETNDIFIPAGYDFDNDLLPVFIKGRLNANRSQVLVFDTDSNWQAIDKKFFVKGKRSAVRLTELKHD